MEWVWMEYITRFLLSAAPILTLQDSFSTISLHWAATTFIVAVRSLRVPEVILYAAARNNCFIHKNKTIVTEFSVFLSRWSFLVADDAPDYWARSFFTRVDMRRPSARPARRFVATPITFPISDGCDAPTSAIIFTSSASTSASESCFGR